MNLCNVKECDREHYAKGMCKMHHLRFWRYGRIDRLPRSNTYAAVHQWAKRNIKLGGKCYFCGTSSKRLELINLNHQYERNEKDWKTACASCHRNYDVKHNDYKNGSTAKADIL